MYDSEENVAALVTAVEHVERAPWNEDLFTHASLRRYLRARQGKVAAAAKNLCDTVEWRREFWPLIADDHYRPVASTHEKAFTLRPISRDEDGDIVMYSHFGKGKRPSAQEYGIHVVRSMEIAITMAETDDRIEHGAGKVTWVSDFFGFSLSDCNPRLYSTVLKVLDRHYPERLKRIVLVDAPRIFSGLYRAISPLVSPETRDKVLFLAARDLQTGIPGVPEPVGEWMVTEFAELRDKCVFPHKSWWSDEADKATGTSHCSRGYAPFLQQLDSAHEALQRTISPSSSTLTKS